MGNVLSADDFEILADKGLGRKGSTVAHAMAEFEGNIYVGTTTPSPWSEDAKPCIFVFDPKANTWEVAYEPERVDIGSRVNASSGLTKNGGSGMQSREHSPIQPVDFGYRSMVVYQGKSDKKPCLYTTSLSVLGGRILRSEDGKTFEPVGEPGLGNTEILSFRSLTVINGKLFTLPVGSIDDTEMDRNIADEAMIYVTSDPAAGVWEEACEQGFGDPQNVCFFSLGACGKYIYTGTCNPQRGFQLWRSKATGKAPYKWEKVLTEGAYRYGFNFTAATLTEFNGALYIGSGITGFGYDKPTDIGPAAAELIRLNPDDSWDLIFGDARFTPDGLKIPYSGMGPGMDNPHDSVTWAMASHDGVLYFGTHNWATFANVTSKTDPKIEGGYNLWGSANGEDWELALSGEEINPCETGVRTLCSTKDGLYVGTFNHTKLVQLMGKLSGFQGDLSGFDEGFSVLRGA